MTDDEISARGLEGSLISMIFKTPFRLKEEWAEDKPKIEHPRACACCGAPYEIMCSYCGRSTPGTAVAFKAVLSDFSASPGGFVRVTGVTV